MPFSCSRSTKGSYPWLIVLLTVSFSSVLGINNNYCKTAEQCLPCRTTIDACQPIDRYYGNGDVCVLPSRTQGPKLCGEPLLLSLQGPDRTVAGNVTIFQSTDFFLYVTFQMGCPFVLRSLVESTTANYSTALYIWNDLSLRELPQYVNIFPADGTYTCITYSIDLSHVCDPQLSLYSFNPLAHSNHGCDCLNDVQSCPPANLVPNANDPAGSSRIVLTPSAFGVAADRYCRDSGSYVPLSVVTKDGSGDGSGNVFWSPRTCMASSPPSLAPPPASPPPTPTKSPFNPPPTSTPPWNISPELGHYPPKQTRVPSPPASLPPFPPAPMPFDNGPVADLSPPPPPSTLPPSPIPYLDRSDDLSNVGAIVGGVVGGVAASAVAVLFGWLYFRRRQRLRMDAMTDDITPVLPPHRKKPKHLSSALSQQDSLHSPQQQQQQSGVAKSGVYAVGSGSDEGSVSSTAMNGVGSGSHESSNDEGGSPGKRAAAAATIGGGGGGGEKLVASLLLQQSPPLSAAQQYRDVAGFDAGNTLLAPAATAPAVGPSEGKMGSYPSGGASSKTNRSVSPLFPLNALPAGSFGSAAPPTTLQQQQMLMPSLGLDTVSALGRALPQGTSGGLPPAIGTATAAPEDIVLLPHDRSMHGPFADLAAVLAGGGSMWSRGAGMGSGVGAGMLAVTSASGPGLPLGGHGAARSREHSESRALLPQVPVSGDLDDGPQARGPGWGAEAAAVASGPAAPPLGSVIAGRQAPHQQVGNLNLATASAVVTLAGPVGLPGVAPGNPPRDRRQSSMGGSIVSFGVNPSGCPSPTRTLSEFGDDDVQLAGPPDGLGASTAACPVTDLLHSTAELSDTDMVSKQQSPNRSHNSYTSPRTGVKPEEIATALRQARDHLAGGSGRPAELAETAAAAAVAAAAGAAPLYAPSMGSQASSYAALQPQALFSSGAGWSGCGGGSMPTGPPGPHTASPGGQGLLAPQAQQMGMVMQGGMRAVSGRGLLLTDSANSQGSPRTPRT